MADVSTIIEGTVKFRDGKKWKSRWCVMRKLSPVADCVQLQLYRDARARCAGAASKASLSLQHYLGSEAGFTLDKQSNTLALVCRDLVAVLAFETRERLLQWQAKVRAQLGDSRHYLVLVRGGARRLPAGPARLHVRESRAALTAGAPPRLLGLWELPHLRRYGVVEGRFCFEGGSLCGKGEGLHVLVTDQAHEISRDFDLASQGRLSPRRRPDPPGEREGPSSPRSHRAYRPDTRLSELNTVERSLPPLDFGQYDEAYGGEEAGAVSPYSPYWPSVERGRARDMGLGDAASMHEGEAGDAVVRGRALGDVTLERCTSCMSKLGALSRSSTAALTPGAKHFSPAWTMEPVREARPDPTVQCDGASVPHAEPTTRQRPERLERPPERPPKPTRLDLNLNEKPARCSCVHSAPAGDRYHNYDVPKLALAEVEGQHYDTPKRLRECVDDELFRVTNGCTSSTVILKKRCGCLLKFGKRQKEPMVVDSEENFQSSNCPCRRVTDWANSWIKLPYCRKNIISSDSSMPSREELRPTSVDSGALYATVDLARKARHRRGAREDRGPLAAYENLSFALSLEHYENAKNLLRKAGVTQKEIDAIGANLRPPSPADEECYSACSSCGHRQHRPPRENFEALTLTNDDYLMMEPGVLEGNRRELNKPPPPGYTPMSPVGGFAQQTLKHSTSSPISRLLEEKSASNPALCGVDDGRRTRDSVAAVQSALSAAERVERIEYRKRSSSADSSRFLEDVKEFDGSVGSRGSNSSIETLRNTPAAGRAPTPCDCAVDLKHSDADSSSSSKGAALAERSPSAPGKAAANRDSSSSNDSGVSSCSLRRAGLADFELPPTSAAARRHYRSARRAAAGPLAAAPRRAKSTDPPGDGARLQRGRAPAKSSSAEAEVPVLGARPLRGVADTHSTSSGTSDMSDYIETLSICSSHSSSDAPVTMRALRRSACTCTLRPRSGKEYLSVDARLAGVLRAAPARGGGGAAR